MQCQIVSVIQARNDDKLTFRKSYSLPKWGKLIFGGAFINCLDFPKIILYFFAVSIVSDASAASKGGKWELSITSTRLVRICHRQMMLMRPAQQTLFFCYILGGVSYVLCEKMKCKKILWHQKSCPQLMEHKVKKVNQSLPKLFQYRFYIMSHLLKCNYLFTMR